MLKSSSQRIVSDGKYSNHQVKVVKDASLHWVIILEKDWQEVCGPLSLSSSNTIVPFV